MPDESDFVQVGKLSYETKQAWGIDRTYLLPEVASWLFFRLREMPDSPELFPKGKWASIQFLEGLIVEQAKKAPLEAEHG